MSETAIPSKLPSLRHFEVAAKCRIGNLPLCVAAQAAATTVAGGIRGKWRRLEIGGCQVSAAVCNDLNALMLELG